MSKEEIVNTTKCYYLAYGAALHPKLLAARLGPEKPLSSHTVRVPTAFLSFDMRGLPFVEPCFCNALVQGVNDGEWPKGGEGERREEGEVYRKWVWERCCPGLEYTGELPPRLEGVAYELSESHFAQVMNANPRVSSDVPLSSSPAATAYRVVEVHCDIFTNGDSSKTLGSLVAHMPIVEDDEARAPGLQPTLRYLRLVLLGAFFSTLSQPYLANLTLLRPFHPTSTLAKTLTSHFFTLLLIPPFLFVHLPTLLAKRLFGEGVGWGRVGKWAQRGGWGFLRGAEGVMRRFGGSGYFNEGEGGGESVGGKVKRE